MLQLLLRAPLTVQDTAAGILGNLAIQNPTNQAAIVAAGALPPLVELLLKGSAPAKEQACFALWNLACQHPENQVAIELVGAGRDLTTLEAGNLTSFLIMSMPGNRVSLRDLRVRGGNAYRAPASGGRARAGV